MTARVVTVRSDAPISAAVERMTRYGFSALPVVDAAHRLVGIVSLLDIVRFREDHEPDDDAPVDVVMSTDVLSMSPNANASVVANRLRTNGQLRVMPIVERGRLVGVVTRSDLLRPPKQGGGLGAVLRRRFGGDRVDDEVLLALARPRRAGPAAASTAPVREVMSTEVVTIGATQPVSDAAELLLRNRFTALPVVDEQHRLLGIVSEADLLGAPAVGRREQRTVGAIMTRQPVVIGPSATVAEARSLVADRGLRVVPVVEGGRLVGVLSRSDLV